jgi:hypothetical protein
MFDRRFKIWAALFSVGWILLITGWTLPGPQPELSGTATLLFVALVIERAQNVQKIRRRQKADALRARAEAEHLAALTPEDRQWLREQGWQR